MVRNQALVVNKVHRQLDMDELKMQIEHTYEAPMLGVFPLSEDVAHVASDGVFSLKNPAHAISQNLAQVARRVMEIA